MYKRITVVGEECTVAGTRAVVRSCNKDDEARLTRAVQEFWLVSIMAIRSALNRESHDRYVYRLPNKIIVLL